MVDGLKKNGKQWHETKKAFRPTSGLTPYKQRIEQQKRMAVTKLVEKEMKEEKVSKRQLHIQKLKERREAREEKVRHEKLAQRMHAKKVERLKKREKRNKMLRS